MVARIFFEFDADKHWLYKFKLRPSQHSLTIISHSDLEARNNLWRMVFQPAGRVREDVQIDYSSSRHPLRGWDRGFESSATDPHLAAKKRVNNKLITCKKSKGRPKFPEAYPLSLATPHNLHLNKFQAWGSIEMETCLDTVPTGHGDKCKRLSRERNTHCYCKCRIRTVQSFSVWTFPTYAVHSALAQPMLPRSAKEVHMPGWEFVQPSNSDCLFCLQSKKAKRQFLVSRLRKLHHYCIVSLLLWDL